MTGNALSVAVHCRLRRAAGIRQALVALPGYCVGGVLLLAAALPVRGVAQPVPKRVAGFAAGVEQFVYAGSSEDQLVSFTYEGPALSLYYRKLGLSATLTAGTGSPFVWDITGSAVLPIPGLDLGKYGLRVVSNAVTGHRVVHHATGARWGATRLGLGVGVQWAPVGKPFIVRANPLINFMGSSLSIETRFTPGAEADLTLWVAKLRPRRELELGYIFRYQVWTIVHLSSTTEGFLIPRTYNSRSHLLRAGIRF